MSQGAIIAIAVVVLAILAVIVVGTAAKRGDARTATGALSRETRKRDRGEPPVLREEAPAVTGREVELAAASARTGTALATVSAPPPAPYVPPDPEALGVTRRQFFNRGITVLMIVGLSGFGAAVLGFLWPKLSGGFGSRISIGKIDDVIATIRANKNFAYYPEGRAWVTEFPIEAVPKARAAYQPSLLEGFENGLVALYQKCPHLGCRVPECTSSQWFECPCHGSQYNRVGEKKGGPAPRGMDHFPISVQNGNVIIDTGSVVQGAPIGTNTTGQEAEGPHCVTGGGGH